jgi:hypothetical protein
MIAIQVYSSATAHTRPAFTSIDRASVNTVRCSIAVSVGVGHTATTSAKRNFAGVERASISTVRFTVAIGVEIGRYGITRARFPIPVTKEIPAVSNATQVVVGHIDLRTCVQDEKAVCTKDVVP